MSKSLGQLAYEIHARQTGITVQRDKHNLTRDHEGPMPWERLSPFHKNRWERFAIEFAREVRALQDRAFAEMLRKKGATLEDERGVRAQLLEQEKRRQEMERKNET